MKNASRCITVDINILMNDMYGQYDNTKEPLLYDATKKIHTYLKRKTQYWNRKHDSELILACVAMGTRVVLAEYLAADTLGYSSQPTPHSLLDFLLPHLHYQSQRMLRKDHGLGVQMALGVSICWSRHSPCFPGNSSGGMMGAGVFGWSFSLLVLQLPSAQSIKRHEWLGVSSMVTVFTLNHYPYQRKI